MIAPRSSIDLARPRSAANDVRRVSAVILMCVAVGTCSAAPVLAVEPANYTNEIHDLAADSAIVVLGNIERRDIGVSETTAYVRVVKSFYGSVAEGQRIQFKTRSGRVQVSQNQPDITGIDRAIFYLSQDSDGSYRSVNDAYGFKPIIHDNVYTNPQNPLETVKLKKYQESLSVLAPSKP